MSDTNKHCEVLSREEFSELYNILLFLNIDAATETDPAVRQTIRMVVQCLEAAYNVHPTYNFNENDEDSDGPASSIKHSSYAASSTANLSDSNEKGNNKNKNLQYKIPFYTSKEPLLKRVPTFHYLSEAIDRRVHILSPISESPAQTHRSASDNNDEFNQDIPDIGPSTVSSHTDHNYSNDAFERDSINSSRVGSPEELPHNDECFAVVAQFAPRKASSANSVKESKDQKFCSFSNSKTDNNTKDPVAAITEPQSPNIVFNKLLNVQIPSHDDICDDPELYNFRGNELSNTGNFKEALIYYNKAMHLNPKEPVYIYNRAMAYFDLKIFVLCVKDLKEVIQMDLNNAMAYNALGNAYYEMYQFRKAEKEYTKALKLEPDNVEYKENLLFVQKTIDEDF